MTMDQLTLERRDGWPNALSHLMLGTWVVLYGYGLAAPGPELERRLTLVAWCCLGSGLVLRTYRRGIRIDRRTRTLYRWWGLRVPLMATIPIRYWGERSLQGFHHVRVCRTTALDTWKTWRRNMLHVQVERPDDRLGPGVAFRYRVIIDDEFVHPEHAVRVAGQVADFTAMQVVGELENS